MLALIAVPSGSGVTVRTRVKETPWLAQLRGLGCDFVQGYLVSGPLRRRTLEDWLLESRWGPRGEAAPLAETADG